MALPASYSSRPVVVGSMSLCLNGPPTPARITSVTPYQGNGGLVITSFATQANPLQHHLPNVISSHRSITALGFKRRSTTVTEPCQATTEPGSTRRVPGGFNELLVTYQRAGQATGSDHGVIVNYTADGSQQHMIAQLGVSLCGPHDQFQPCATTGK
jgi:hypothetical protein